MPAPDPLADLRDRFIARSRERIASLRALIDDPHAAADPHAGEGLDESRAATIARLAHQLAGAAGCFGYPALGAAAAALEDRTHSAAADGTTFKPSQLAELVATLEARMAELGGNDPRPRNSSDRP